MGPAGRCVGRHNGWSWVFHRDDRAAFMVEPRRAKKGVQTFLGEYRPQFGVCDRLAAPIGGAAKARPVGRAALLRDAQHALDSGDAAFSPGGTKLACQRWRPTGPRCARPEGRGRG